MMIIESLLLLVIFGSILGLAHSYFLYPLSLVLLLKLRGSEQTAADRDGLPSVALVIAAYNEEEIIAQKIENSLELSYPADLLEIVVFSDASDDRTDQIVGEYQDQGVSLVRIEGRVGKTECQNRVADQVDEDILLFSDANSMYEPEAITELVDGFEDNVGCVVGELQYRESSEVKSESTYWRYESWIKQLESRFHSLVTANGSIYAVKTESYVPQPPDTISDFTEPLSIVRAGQSVKYAPEAVAWENTGSSTSEELQRRVRIVTRSWNSVMKFLDLMNPVRYPRFAYQLLSHKILRWLSPVLLISLLVATAGQVLITGRPLYQLLLACQVAGYGVGAIGLLADRLGIALPTPLRLPYYFFQANYGMLIGLLNFLRGENIVLWETSDRASE